MLLGINPLLTGELLKALDEMGHSDGVLIADANYPAHASGLPVIELPGIDSVAVTRAICEVLPLDADKPPAVMADGTGTMPAIQHDLLAAAGVSDHVSVERWEFYDLARSVSLIVSSGDRRLWANVLLYKGLVRE